MHIKILILLLCNCFHGMKPNIFGQTVSMIRIFGTLILAAALMLSPPLSAASSCMNNDPNPTDAEIKTICLTFDDGPTDSTTPKILDILQKEKIHATFFVIGRQISRRKEILQRIFDEGHSIGIHTYSHEYKQIYASSAALLGDIRRCQKSIREVLPEWSSDLYRFPGGEAGLSDALIAAVKKAGYKICGWNASIEDAVSPNATAEDLYNNAVRSAGEKNHVVLLLHDGVGYRETVRALPKIINYFRCKDYKFQTL